MFVNLDGCLDLEVQSFQTSLAPVMCLFYCLSPNGGVQEGLSGLLKPPVYLSFSHLLLAPLGGKGEKGGAWALHCSALLFLMANGTKLLSSCHTLTYKSYAHKYTHTYRGKGLKLGCQPVENHHSVIPAHSRSFLPLMHTSKHSPLPFHFFLTTVACVQFPAETNIDGGNDKLLGLLVLFKNSICLCSLIWLYIWFSFLFTCSPAQSFAGTLYCNIFFLYFQLY